MKNCTKCKELKNLEDFDLQKSGKYGRMPNCKSCRKLYAKQFYEKNTQFEKDRASRYYAENKTAIYLRHKKYETNRKKEDLNFRLAKNLRCRLSMAVKTYKNSSAVLDLGCSLESFKAYMETKFTSGMSWANYGEWEIDHVVPLSKFDLTNEQESKSATHFSNLQPLWLRDNRSKGAKLWQS